ncbi:MAG TPA: threonine/serine exporter family protein [Gemmatimonadaceae bacterium]|nr:threonine/serine exporter family protein [Gemmatimonadaceae bacterium]
MAEPSVQRVERHRDEPDPAAVGFVLQLGHALHAYGESAQRLEEFLGDMSDRLGLHGAQFFSTPTSIMASFGPLGRQHTHMLRVEPGEVNLAKLAELERVSVEVAHGRYSPEKGRDAITRIAAAPSPYGPALTTLAFGVVSGAAGQFLGGGGREILVATLLGFGVGLFALLAGRVPRLGRVFEPLAAFLVSVAAIALTHVTGPFSVVVATLAGLIVLVPGLTLTTAMSELATRHLASGTARISGAFITFLGIAFGVALGNRLGAAVFGAPPMGGSAPLPGWAGLVAVVLAPLCFTVILRAQPRDAPWIVAAGALGVVGGRLGAATLGVELGTFAGAFAVALASSAYERWRHRPAAVVLVPGILLLVPGSVGFRSLTSLLERQALAGIQTAFSMILTAIALVAGLLIAGVIAPQSRVREMPKR